MATGRKFAAFDIDGTLIRWQLYHALADELATTGGIDSKSYRIMQAVRLAWKNRQEASFRNYELEVIRVYEQVLLGLSFAMVGTAVNNVFEEYKDQTYTYTRGLIKDLKAEGYFLLAISGSQTEIVEKIAEYYGFDDFVGTVYERKGGRFSGNKTIGSHRKDKVLKELVAKHSLSFEKSIAIGDSASDVAMLKLAEHPIVFNPEKSLFATAQAAGWKVIVERKNMIYELESKSGQYQLVKTNA